MGKLRAYVLSISVLCLFTFTLKTRAQPPTPVALQVYFEDGFAFPASSKKLFQEIYKKLRPELKFKLMSGSPDEVLNELRKGLSTDEELKVLIIDTHGGTDPEREGQSHTVLRHLGKVGEQQVDQEFLDNFKNLKTSASDDLQIIMNSCSVFCGTQESASKRAKTFLQFFEAQNGSIYGSDVLEVPHSFDDKEFFRWRYLLPDFKMLTTVVGVTTALLSPVLGWESIGAGIVMGALASVMGPSSHALLSKYFLNRGFNFSFKNGQLDQTMRVVKYEDLRKLIKGELSYCENLLNSH